MKRILLITRDFPPYGSKGGVMRILKFAKYLPEYGWQSSILTEERDEIEDSSLLDQLSSDVRITYVDPETPRKKKNRYKKLLVNRHHLTWQELLKYFLYRSIGYNIYAFYHNYFRAPDTNLPWALYAEQTAVELHKKYCFDAFLTSGPPFSTFKIGLRLKEKLQIPWILDFRDGWAGNPLYRQSKKLLIRWQNRKIERDCMINSDMAMYVSRSLYEIYKKRYPECQSKMTITTNGYDPEDFKKITKHETKKDKLHFMFSGTISGKRSPTHFFNALQKTLVIKPEMKDHLQVTFLGKFNYTRLSDPLSHILHIEGMMPHRKALKRMAEADVFLLIINSDLGGKTIMSSKIFEYLAFEKPILIISKPCAATELVQRLNVGYLADYSNEDQIKDRIIEIYDNWRENKLKIQILPDELEKFDRKKLTYTLSRQLDRLIQRQIISEK